MLRDAAYARARAELAGLDLDDDERDRLATAFARHVETAATAAELNGEAFRNLAAMTQADPAHLAELSIRAAWGSFLAGLAAALPPERRH